MEFKITTNDAGYENEAFIKVMFTPGTEVHKGLVTMFCGDEFSVATTVDELEWMVKLLRKQME